MKALLAVLSVVFIAFGLTAFVGENEPKSQNNLTKNIVNFGALDSIYTTDPASIKLGENLYNIQCKSCHALNNDVANNRILVADIGEASVEEINIVRKGGDYGWPQREGIYRIDTRETLREIYKITPTEQAMYRLPFAFYDHTAGNAISGGFIYEGKLTSLQHKYIFGDIVNGTLYYVNMDAKLTDSRIYQLAFTINGEPAKEEFSNKKRTTLTTLRIGYDDFTKEMYVMNKTGIMRRISSVKIKEGN